MSFQLIEELAKEHDMRPTLIQAFTTQREADDLYRALQEDKRVTLNFITLMFASGAYYVILLPHLDGAK